MPYRYSLPRMLVLLRIGWRELRDDVSRWLEARRSPRVVEYDPGADLCGRFAECLRGSGFAGQADSVWKADRSDDWTDQAHSPSLSLDPQ